MQAKIRKKCSHDNTYFIVANFENDVVNVTNLNRNQPFGKVIFGSSTDTNLSGGKQAFTTGSVSQLLRAQAITVE